MHLVYQQYASNHFISFFKQLVIRIQGELDIVIHAKIPSMIPVLYIVEAKRNDIIHGRAQLYPQLKMCYEL
jgi:hypothetical protein